MKKATKEKKPNWFEPYGSEEEQYFAWWLEELKQAGYVLEFTYEPHKFYLSGPVEFSKIKQLKTKTKVVEFTMLKGHIYTPDFGIKWTEKAKGVFFSLEEDVNTDLPFIGYPLNGSPGIYFSFDEVKPCFDQNNMTRAFKINQKWVYQVHRILINLIIPAAPNKTAKTLFSQTFTPARYLWQNIGGKPRKIHFNIVTLSDYLNKFKK